MHVEEHEAIAFNDGGPVRGAHVSADFVGEAYRHVTRNDRIRHARETTVPEMHVGPADLGVHRPQQGGARFERRFGELADFNRHARCRHHGS